MPATNDATRRSWNRGLLISPKPPLKPKHIWAIRTRLQHEGRIRDLALSNAGGTDRQRGASLLTS